MMETRNEIKQKVLSGLFWKFGERVTAQAISLGVSIVLARLLLPTDYGEVALVMVFINIANVFVCSGFGNALIQKKDADNLDFSSVFYINILISIIIYFLIYLLAPFVAEFYGMSILRPILRILGIRIIVAAVNSVQQAYIARNMLFKRFFWSTFFGTLVSGVVGVVMAYCGFGVWSLVIQYLVNVCMDTTVLWFTVKWRPKRVCSWKRVKVLISFGWKLLVSGLLDAGYNELRNLVIGKVYSSSDLAYYNQGDKYPKLIVVNINSSISSVLFPAMSHYQDNRECIKEMTRNSIRICSYIMWPVMCGLAVIAEPLVRMMLTEKWISCVPYLRIFCFSYGLWPVHTSNLQALNAMGRSDLFLKLEVVKKTIGILALVFSLYKGPLAIAWSLFLTGIISTFINAAPNRKLLKYSYKEQFVDLLPSFLLSLIMAFIIYPISFLKLPDLFLVALQMMIGLIFYLSGSFITKNPSFLYLTRLIKQKQCDFL